MPRPKSILNATSAGVDAAGKTYVVLYWSASGRVSGYNLYRSASGERPKRLNGAQPIARVKTCAELQAIVAPGTPEWTMLANAFTGVTARAKLVRVSDKFGRMRMADRSALAALRGVRGALGTIGTVGTLVVDPCDALNRGLTAEEERLFGMLAAANLKIRAAYGLAWIDETVQAEERYVYELRGVLGDGSEVPLSATLKVWAGHYQTPDPPSGISAEGADSKVLLLWNGNPYTFSYSVQRSVNPNGPWQVIHAEPIQFDIGQDLAGKPLQPARPGFLDFQRWNEQGEPASHDVNGVAIDGPENGTTYYYRVASFDILGRSGQWSAPVPATPVHTVPPLSPSNVRADLSKEPLGIALSWHKVTRDVLGHKILDASQTYRIYRAPTQAELENLAALGAYLVAAVTAVPGDTTTPVLDWLDTDPVLAPPYGERDYWYRVACVDQDGIQSAPSAIVSARIPDTTPPGPTIVAGAKGFVDHIRVCWWPNSEPDLGGYQIYRGICDRGRIYTPKPRHGDPTKPPVTGCDMVLVGTVPLAEVEAHTENGSICFDDYSVPEGSPLCYAYWVRAYDTAQNLYPGAYGCPASDKEYVCQRLYEQKPPPAPIITALKARNKSVLLEWIASPLQDLRAFHVYRGEREDDVPQFLGCVLSDGTPWPGRWKGMQPACQDIPAEADPATAHGTYLDATAEPNRVYWYRVSALDWLGNESEGADLTKLPAISTFTYARELAVALSVRQQGDGESSGCGLTVAWEPEFDSQVLEGFVVFRGPSAVGAYRQVSPVVAGNSFRDMSARRGVDYWYRVQALGKDGLLSAPSTPLLCRY